MKTVVLDAGHGAHDSGAVGPTGLREKDVALSIVLKMRQILYAMGGFEVILTREGDTFLELSARAEIANKNSAVAFLSVHCNSAENASASGFEVFTTKGQTKSDKWATLAFLDYAAEFPDLRKRLDTADGDEDKESNFTVILKANCPAILFETEFISNPAAEKLLRSDNFQSRIAVSLCRSLISFLGVSGTPASPPPVADDKPARIKALAQAIIDLA